MAILSTRVLKGGPGGHKVLSLGRSARLSLQTVKNEIVIHEFHRLN